MCKDRERGGILDFGFQILDCTIVVDEVCNSFMLIVRVVDQHL